MAKLGSELLFCGGFGGFDFGSGVGVFLGEAFDATGGVNQLLLAGKERVAIGADFDTELIAFDGRASLEIIAASAMHCDGVIVGVDTGFHDAPFCRVRSARLARSWERGSLIGMASYSRVARSRSNLQLYGKLARFQNRAVRSGIDVGL